VHTSWKVAWAPPAYCWLAFRYSFCTGKRQTSSPPCSPALAETSSSSSNQHSWKFWGRPVRCVCVSVDKSGVDDRCVVRLLLTFLRSSSDWRYLVSCLWSLLYRVRCCSDSVPGILRLVEPRPAEVG
jgi:hypothetical protein